MLHNALGCRAAADIAETDEDDFVWIFFSDGVLVRHKMVSLVDAVFLTENIEGLRERFKLPEKMIEYLGKRYSPSTVSISN